MAWWRRAWDWLSQGKRWLILPVVLAGVAALVGLLRGRRDGPSPGSASGAGPAPVGEAADDAREVIREEAGDARAAADDRAEKRLSAIEEARARMREGKP